MERVTRLVLPALVLLALYYALFGGEYSVFEVRRARAERDQAVAELERMRRVNDSLRAWADSLQHDSATLERIARENFGLVRQGEILYRIVEPVDTGDSTGGS